MFLSKLDRKIIWSCCQYLNQKEGKSKRIQHGVKMIQNDLEKHYNGLFMPSRARLNQIVHVVHEVVYLELFYLEQKFEYPPDMMLQDRPHWSDQYKNRISEYYAKQVERLNAIPSIVKEHGKELNGRLHTWYQRNEKVDGQTRVVEELENQGLVTPLATTELLTE